MKHKDDGSSKPEVYSVRSNISFSITKGVSYAMEEYFPLSVVPISISFLLSAVFQRRRMFPLSVPLGHQA